MIKIIILFLVLSICSLYSIDINTSIKLAFSNNLELIDLSNQIAIQRINVENLNLSYLPEFSFSYSYTGNYLTSNSFLSLSPSVDYKIYDGYYKIYKLNYLKSLIKYLENVYYYKLNEIKYMTMKFYYSVVLYKKIYELSGEGLKQAIKQKKIDEGKYKEGLIDKLTYLSSVQFYLTSEYNVLSALNNYNERLNELKYFLKYDSIQNIEDDLIIVEKIINFSNDIRLSNLILQSDIVRQSYSVSYASVDWNVILFGHGTYTYSVSDSIRNDFSINAGLKIYLPIFDWLTLNASSTFNTKSFTLNGNININDQNNLHLYKKSLYLSNVSQLKYLESEYSKIHEQNFNYNMKIQELELALSSASNNIELSKLFYEKTKILYEFGEKTAKELLDSKLMIFISEVEYLKSIYYFNILIWQLQSYCF